jgi:hypothetical protein
MGVLTTGRTPTDSVLFPRALDGLVSKVNYVQPMQIAD